MIDDYILDKVLDKVKEIISIENLMILFDTGDKIPDNVTLANPVILRTCFIK